MTTQSLSVRFPGATSTDLNGRTRVAVGTKVIVTRGEHQFTAEVTTHYARAYEYGVTNTQTGQKFIVTSAQMEIDQ